MPQSDSELAVQHWLQSDSALVVLVVALAVLIVVGTIIRNYFRDN